MLRFRVMPKSKYDSLVNDRKAAEEKVKLLQDKLERANRDIESLRKQLNERIYDVRRLKQFKTDTLSALGKIDFAGFCLSICNAKCDCCAEESDDCKKFQFGKHLFCLKKKIKLTLL